MVLMINNYFRSEDNQRYIYWNNILMHKLMKSL